MICLQNIKNFKSSVEYFHKFIFIVRFIYIIVY